MVLYGHSRLQRVAFARSIVTGFYPHTCFANIKPHISLGHKNYPLIGTFGYQSVGEKKPKA